MLIQIGDKEFSGVLAPSDWSYGGGEANLAEHALINAKPRLQHTGEALEELSLRLHLRAEFCHPEQELADFDEWKSTGEILPLLLGTGEYRGDYLLQGIATTINQTFDDGAIIDAEVTLTLVEYVAADPLRQQQMRDRQNATAVGDVAQTTPRRAQARTPQSEAHAALMEAQIESWNAADEARRVMETGQPENYVERVHKLVARAQSRMAAAREKINAAQAKISGAKNIVDSIQDAIDKLGGLDNLMQPPINLNNLDYGIIDLQSAIRGVDTSSTGFTQSIILRKP